MESQTKLIARINYHQPKGVEIKKNEKSIVVTLPNHSCHSAVLDPAFRFAEANGIKFKSVGHQPGMRPWKVKFF